MEEEREQGAMGRAQQVKIDLQESPTVQKGPTQTRPSHAMEEGEASQAYARVVVAARSSQVKSA